MLHHNVLLSVDLTIVTSRDYVTNINMWKTSDVTNYPLPKHFVSSHEASHHAWAPDHLNPALGRLSM